MTERLAALTRARTNTSRTRKTVSGTRAVRRPWFEALENRNLLSISLQPIPDVAVPVLAPVPVEVNGSDSYGGQLTYTVASNSTAVQPILTSAANPVVKMSVAGYGDMKFQLYQDLVPDAVGHFLDVVNSGAYSNKTIYRVQTNFVIQGGLSSYYDPSVVQFDDQFDPNLRFTRRGVLAMANRGSDTNTAEFFIIDDPLTARHLDHRYTIIGFLTEGEGVRQELQADGISTNSGVLAAPITLTSISVVSNAQSAVLLLSVPTLPANPQAAQVTVMVKNSHGESVTQTFKVTPTADTHANADAPPYVTQTKVETSVDTPYAFTIATADADGKVNATAYTYTATLVDGNGRKANNPLVGVSVSAQTGSVTVTPSGGVTGVFGLKLGVTDDDGNYSRADTQVVPLYITPAAPASVQLISGTGDGSHTTLDNSSSEQTLTFRVTGVQALSQVTIYAGGRAIGSVLVPAGANTIDVITDGVTALAAGGHPITAKQLIQQHDVSVGNWSARTVDLVSPASPSLWLLVNATEANNDGLGLYDPATSVFYLRNSNTTGMADKVVGFGAPGAGWLPVAGDWNGDGIDTVGLYDPASALFYLRNANTTGAADITLGFGAPNAGWLPVVGDWDGDGADTPGLYDPAKGIFYGRNANATGMADFLALYADVQPGCLPIAGDWDADHVDTLGLYDPQTSLFRLRNANANGTWEAAFGYGAPQGGYQPLPGDWSSQGAATIGLYSGPASTFLLRNANSTGMADLTCPYGPPGAGWLPVVGNWNGPGVLGLQAVGRSPSAAEGGAPIGEVDLQPLIDAAIARWADADVSPGASDQARLVTADLPGGYLSMIHDGVVYLDRDAAGYGWFVDPTPALDEEFYSAADGKSLAAGDSQAAGRMDLLTVVAHELGHIAGLTDLDVASDLLASDLLAVGIRRRV